MMKKTVLSTLLCSMFLGLGCVGGADVDEHHEAEHVHVRQSEILYVMNEEEADDRFAQGSADFLPVNDFEQVQIAFTAGDVSGVQYQLRDAQGEWGEWLAMPMDWSADKFHNTLIDLGAGNFATGLRMRGVSELEFARLEFLGEEEDQEVRPDIVSELRRPGKWQPSAEALAAGSRVYLPYESAGTRCSGGMTPGARELGAFIHANFDGVASVQGYNCRKIGGSNKLSLHGVGRALDIMIPVDGSWSDRASADNDKGDPVADWLIKNADVIGIQYIVWDRRSWGAHRSGNKMRDYGGQHAHHDHLHVELTTAAANRRTAFFNGNQPSTASGDSRCLADANFNACEGTTALSCGANKQIERAVCGYYGLSCSASGGPARCIFPTRYDTLVGDFDGNGKQDVATLSSNAGGGWANWYSVDLSTGNGFSSKTWSSRTPQHMRNGDGDKHYRALVGDFDGNGKDDVATLGLNGGGAWKSWIAMDLSTGSGFSSTTWNAATPIHIRNGASSRDYRTVVGDFDGNGKDDLATLSINGGGGWAEWVAMELSTGKGFSSKTWKATTPVHIRNGGANNDYRVMVGDFNGDGKDDLATITRNGQGGWSDWVSMELSTGSGFSSKVWRATTPIHMRNGGAGNDYRVMVGDFNGDGKDDLATITRNGGGGWANWVAVELSTGKGFTSKTFASKTPKHMRNGGANNDYRTLVGDVNGDGRDDLLTITRNGQGGWSSWASVDFAGSSSFDTKELRTATPTHMRNGGAGQDYRPLLEDFNGDGRADLAVISPNGGGGWADWMAMDISRGTSFGSTVWATRTPQHMRNGRLF